MPANPIPRMSLEEYLAFERESLERHEYLNGEGVDRSGGSVRHAVIGHNLAVFLGTHLRKERCLVLSSDVRLGVTEYGAYTYPDLMVVCGEPKYGRGANDTILNPVTVVEVLSPSTENRDRGYKLRYYLKIASLREYVLVAQEEPRVEIYRRAETGEWVWHLIEGGEAEVRLEGVGCTVPMVELYAKVSFENG